ncbi:hypothetical protein [Trinickia mobilis]|uniref:hypothetical protein n=1 Tax=Trinickia mobilis TaxID=2816356 RepID=UPI001A8CB786|nr:hypothetical protein [Trinickia mobilis]
MTRIRNKTLAPAAGAIALFAAMLGAAALSSADEGESIDLFPTQSFASLSAAAQKNEAADIKLITPDEEEEGKEGVKAETIRPMPFSVTAEWKEGRQRVVVLEGMGQIFLICQACSVKDAIRPGKEISGGYQLARLEAAAAVLLTPEKSEVSLPLFTSGT